MLGLIPILGSMFAIGLTIYSMTQIDSIPCKPTSCVLKNETCSERGISFPCYTAKGNYTFEKSGSTYFYTKTLVSKTFYEVANGTCEEFISSGDEECSFKKGNIQNTVSIGGDKYFIPIMIMIPEIMLLCLGITIIIVGFKIDGIVTKQNIDDKESQTTQFPLIPLDSTETPDESSSSKQFPLVPLEQDPRII